MERNRMSQVSFLSNRSVFVGGRKVGRVCFCLQIPRGKRRRRVLLTLEVRESESGASASEIGLHAAVPKSNVDH